MGVLGFFPVGRSIMGRWMTVFIHSFIHSFILSFIYSFAAPRRFSVDAVKNMRDWQKNHTELQRLSEEDSNRARLPGGGRKKASEELEINVGMDDQQMGQATRGCPAK